MSMPRSPLAMLSLLALTPACTRDGGLTKFNSLPEAQILSPEDGAAVVEGRSVTLRGQVSDPNHAAGDLRVRWFVADAEACPDAPVDADGATVCPIVVPGADGLEVRLEVLDPEGAAGVATASYTVTPNEAPSATLVEPVPTGSYYSDQLVTLRGVVSDPDDETASLVVWWEDGSIRLDDVDATPNGSGDVLGHTRMEEGAHAVELHVLDPAGNEAVASVVLDVGPPNSAPSCAIVSPMAGGASAVGQRLELHAIATDVDIGADRLAVEWSSDRDGALGTSIPDSDGTIAFTAGGLSTDTHRITLRVTDEVGASCTDSIGWTVSAPPEIEWLEPVDGEVANENDVFAFSARVSDPEDVPNDLLVTWESDRDGVLDTGLADSDGLASFTTLALTPGEHVVTVTVTDTAGLSTSARRSVRVNDLPNAPVVRITPTSPYGDDDLTATIDVPASDAEGDPLTYTYAWYRDGVRSGASTGATLPAAATTRGEVWTVEVWANDGLGDGLAGSANVAIVDSLPVVSGVSLSPTAPRTDDTLACATTGGTDADGESVSLAYAWTVNGSTVAATDATLDGAWFVRDDVVTCTVTPSAGTGVGASLTSAPVTIVNTAPELGAVVLTPAAPMRSVDLACLATGDADADGDTVTSTYAWEVDGVAAGTGPTLTGPFTPGAVVTCTATPDDGLDAGVSVSASVTITNEAPVIAAVTLSPSTVATDDTLTANVVVSDAEGDAVSLAYAWYVDGARVGATGPTLDGATWFARDQTVHVEVTPSDADGPGATVTSAALVVENTVPTAPGVEITPADAVAGDDLVCVVTAPASDRDGDTLSYVFAWEVDGVAYAGASATSATSSTVAGADVGAEETWTCSAVASDGTDAGTAGTSSVTTGTGEPTWTAVWSHSLTSTPSGSVVLDGAHMGQGVTTVYGRTAWIQQSDWNVIYIPVTRSTTTLEAVEADVYAPSYGHAALYPRSAKYGYNGASDYLAWWETPSTGRMGVGYGGWYDGCCASSGIVDLTTSLSGYTTGAWHTVRIEQDFMSGEARFFLDGVEVYSTTAAPLSSMSTAYVQLRAGGPRSWSSADVAWSNLVVYEGVR